MSERHDAPWQPIDKHSLRLEPPDILALRVSGEVSKDDMSRLIEEMIRIAAERQRLFCLCDSSKVTSVDADARKVAAALLPSIAVEAIAVFGMSFQIRVLTTLIIKAAALLSRANSSPPTVIFDTEAQARAWLDQRRRGGAQQNDHFGTTGRT